MKYYRKVFVPIEIDESAPAFLRSLQDMESIKHAEVHFVHVFRTITYSFAIGTVPSVYPVEEDRKVIEESITSLLEAMSRKVLGKDFDGKVIHRVLFNDNPKKSFTNYVTEHRPELVIIPTRDKHGLFESSFAAYVNGHTECDVLMLKHKV